MSTETQHYHMSFLSQLGWIRAISDGQALIRLDWNQTGWQSADRPDNVSRETIAQLAEYFAGERQQFTLVINPEGKSAAGKHWLQIMAQIPYGKIVTYSDFAHAAGFPKASRAAGSACASNPIPIIYPCHRVVRSDGSLGNYGGGSDLPPPHQENLARKAALITLEQH